MRSAGALGLALLAASLSGCGRAGQRPDAGDEASYTQEIKEAQARKLASLEAAVSKCEKEAERHSKTQPDFSPGGYEEWAICEGQKLRLSRLSPTYRAEQNRKSKQAQEEWAKRPVQHSSTANKPLIDQVTEDERIRRIAREEMRKAGE